jgi:uncharacterized membrane protein YbhN (UPF0104 family)
VTDAAPGPGSAGDEPDGTATGPITPPPSRRTAVLRTGLIVTVLLVVFLVIIPRYVDYSEVIEAFRDLTLPQVVLMTGLGAAAWFVSGQLFTVLVGFLTMLRGTEAYLILSGIGASIPMGPWNMAVVWVVARGWGVPPQPATSGVALYGLVNTLANLALPLIAVVVVVAAGGASDVNGAVLLVTGIGIVAFLGASALLVAIVRSDRAADWLAGTGQRVAAWVERRLGRTGGPDVGRSIHRFRDQVGAVLRRRGLAAMAVAIGAKLAWCVVLIAALRVVGVPEDRLPPAAVLAVYALVNVITIVPIAPGGAGIPELLYIAGLSTIAGGQWESLITAGVFLFRLYQWFLPIPLAWILLKVARRGRSLLPGTAELRAYARGAPA